ncbi:hypothetical protein CO050_02345 [Candidatus Roizmanbacteria bacterium CG_4_9_14_0_2_um_filter_38_17]|nr:MAG: hypothetical protein CO050_02345 [Candidatus Roizmanbacteria bacterium CG_4_9_14_0_2_um_filter_38_17]
MCYLNADDRESCDVTVNTVSTPTATPTTVPNTPTPTATPTPTPTATPTPIPGFQAYIQAYDADVHSQTSINLQAPPTGGYIVGRNIGAEGIVSRGTGSDLKGYSATNWKSTTDWPIISNNSYFPLALLNNKVPDSTAIDNTPCSGKLNTGCVNSNNPLYDHVSGPLTVENLNVASGKKAVIYVEGNINITENITVNNNGFLMLIATGNINIDKDVTEIQGLYYAGGTFSTGNNLSGYESQLELEGIFIAEKFSLERNLDPASAVNNSNAPAEKFYYKPSLLFSAPEFLQVRYTLWEEVAP